MFASHNQNHVTNDGESVGVSWCRDASGAHDQVFVTVWQLQSFPKAPTLTRGRGLSFLATV